MIFNSIEKPYVKVLRGRVRPYFSPLRRDLKFDSRLVKTDRGYRIIEVPLFIKYDSMSEYRKLTEDIAEWLVHDELKELIFKDEADRLYYAVVDDTTYEDKVYNGGTNIVVRFICGYKYSTEKQLSATGTHEIKGHKSTFWRTRTTFTAKQTGYEFQFNLPGKTSLKDICKIKLNGNFISGDVLEIDYRKRRVRLNGKDITNQLVILQSNFRELDIGQVSFTSSHETTFYYHERYY